MKKKKHGVVLVLVTLPASKSSTASWVFFTIFKHLLRSQNFPKN